MNVKTNSFWLILIKFNSLSKPQTLQVSTWGARFCTDLSPCQHDKWQHLHQLKFIAKCFLRIRLRVGWKQSDRETERISQRRKRRRRTGWHTIWSFTQSFAGHLSLSDQPDVTGAGHVELTGCFIHRCSLVLTANTQTKRVNSSQCSRCFRCSYNLLISAAAANPSTTNTNCIWLWLFQI